MRPERITHGPWIGLDFNPLTDIARTAPLCPDGWVELLWNSHIDGDEPGEFSALRAFGIRLDTAAELLAAVSEVVGGLPSDANTWPDGRMCIGRLVWDSGDREVGLPPSWGVELLEVDEALVYSEPLPLVTCPKCQHQVPLVIACRECKAEMCEDCGDEHLVPDCPPAYASYLAAMTAGMHEDST